MAQAPVKSGFVRCPYNAEHVVSKPRYIYHIMKCKAKMGDTLAVCPYNATHRIAKELFSDHLANCPDANIVVLGKEFEVGHESSLKGNTDVPSYENGVVLTGEMWD